MTNDIENMIRRLIGDDVDATAEIIDQAGTSTSATLLVAAALLSDAPNELLVRAATHALTTRDRQLVEVAVTHFAGDEDLFDALVRDHLSDHPDSMLAAWIAAHHRHPPRTRAGGDSDGHTLGNRP